MCDNAPMARDDPQVNFRIPADLKAQLEIDAEANNRTLTAEIVSRLRGPSSVESFKAQMEKTTLELHYQIARMGLQMLRYAGQMVVAEAPRSFRKTASFQLLEKAANGVRIPPELPKTRRDQEKVVSAETLGRVLEELRNAGKALDPQDNTGID